MTTTIAAGGKDEPQSPLIFSTEHVKLYQGDTRRILREQLAPESIHMCMTSPPYYGLRDYGTQPALWDGSRCNTTTCPDLLDAGYGRVAITAGIKRHLGINVGGLEHLAEIIPGFNSTSDWLPPPAAAAAAAGLDDEVGNE